MISGNGNGRDKDAEPTEDTLENLFEIFSGSKPVPDQVKSGLSLLLNRLKSEVAFHSNASIGTSESSSRLNERVVRSRHLADSLVEELSQIPEFALDLIAVGYGHHLAWNPQTLTFTGGPNRPVPGPDDLLKNLRAIAQSLNAVNESWNKPTPGILGRKPLGMPGRSPASKRLIGDGIYRITLDLALLIANVHGTTAINQDDLGLLACCLQELYHLAFGHEPSDNVLRKYIRPAARAFKPAYEAQQLRAKIVSTNEINPLLTDKVSSLESQTNRILYSGE
jgi:hypothetical protein